jgi:hypothetical protein
MRPVIARARSPGSFFAVHRSPSASPSERHPAHRTAVPPTRILTIGAGAGLRPADTRSPATRDSPFAVPISPLASTSVPEQSEDQVRASQWVAPTPAARRWVSKNTRSPAGTCNSFPAGVAFCPTQRRRHRGSRDLAARSLACTPHCVHASATALRASPHDSGREWVALPFPRGSFTPYSLPFS